jgi:hypothetical protein
VGTIEDLICFGMPILLFVFVAWYARRSNTLMATYRQGQELSRSGQDLIRESIRLQTESNQLMRELIEALRQQR